ncbi:MAG: hypothetical protein WC838_04915 [Candidatus Margulisiibacteriota bacterium]
MPDNQELIWVDKEFAERWKKLTTEHTKRDEQEKVFNEYMEKITKQVREDFKCNLDSLEEDAAMFTGLMIKVKQAFGKAKDEQLNASYELWEKFEAEIPSVTKKTAALIALLTPLREQLTDINNMIGKISTHDIDKLIRSVDLLANSYGTNKEMVEFLVKNFK